MDVIPPLYQFLLLAFATYRAWRLLAEDDILERPRRYIVRLPRHWVEGDEIPRKYRNEIALFLTCPWCAGAWIALLIYAGWMLTLGSVPGSVSDAFVAFVVWFALSASVGVIRTQLDPPEDT